MSDTTLAPQDTYTYPEKLQLVARGLMDPKEVGVVSQEEAMGKILNVVPEEKKAPFLGDFCTFEVSEVPLDLRRHWAKQDTTIVGAFDPETWDAENKNTHRLQARLRCGNINAMLEQTVRDDAVEGFILLLTAGAAALRKMREQIASGVVPEQQTEPKGESVIDIESEVVS